LFYSFFKKLVGKEVAVELKNDVELTGKLHSVDQYLNVKLEDVQVVKKERYPQLVRYEKSAGRLKMIGRLQEVVGHSFT
jgi:small nuclear ribonucleoprotein (snRNP)-like protein